MADALKSKKSDIARSAPPDTQAQTKVVEDKLSPSPQHHTTESYGKNSGDPKRNAKG